MSDPALMPQESCPFYSMPPDASLPCYGCPWCVDCGKEV